MAEDNLLNQKFAVATLKKHGHRIQIAENGKIAVDLFKQNKYDLLLYKGLVVLKEYNSQMSC